MVLNELKRIVINFVREKVWLNLYNYDVLKNDSFYIRFRR